MELSRHPCTRKIIWPQGDPKAPRAIGNKDKSETALKDFCVDNN